MLGVEVGDSGGAGRARQMIKRRVALLQRDHVVLRFACANRGEEFAETPDSAPVFTLTLVLGIRGYVGRGAAAVPERFKGLRIKVRIGKEKLKQIATGLAAEILSGRDGRDIAGDAAQAGLRGSFMDGHGAQGVQPQS